MPKYVFTDSNGHSVTMPMTYLEYSRRSAPECVICGERMKRQYFPVKVNWGGLRPSQGEYSPKMKQLFDTASQRRERFEKEHEEHEHKSTH